MGYDGSMKKAAVWVSVGVVVVSIIIASVVLFKNDQKAEGPEIETQEGSGRLMRLDGVGWPAKKDIRIEGDDASYAVRGTDVYRNGERGDYGERGAQARRVAYFATWMELDPIFASHSVDSGRMKQAIAGLAETQERFKKETGAQNDLYGIEFLQAFVAASNALKAFEAEYSEQGAQALIERMKEANSAYERNVQELQRAIDPIITQKQKLVFLDGQAIASYPQIADDLAVMRRNALAARKEIEKRERCLKESEESCAFQLPGGEEPAAFVPDARKPKLLTAKELHMRPGVRYDGPYRIEGQCWKDDPQPFVYVGMECPDSLDYCFQKSFLAETAYYVEIGTTEAYKKFYDQGIRAIPQSATTPYECTDLEYQMELATLNAMVRAYKKDPLFDRVQKLEGLAEDDREIIERGAAAERAFLERAYPSMQELEGLGHWYGFAYGRLVMKGYAEEQVVRELLIRYGEQREKLADFYLLANKAKFHFDNYLDEFEANRESLSRRAPAYIYPIRSHYSLLYMNASPAAWRSKDHPVYLLKEEEIPKRPAEGGIRSATYVFGKYGKETVLKWQDMYDQIMPFAHDDR